MFLIKSTKQRSDFNKSTKFQNEKKEGINIDKNSYSDSTTQLKQKLNIKAESFTPRQVKSKPNVKIPQQIEHSYDSKEKLNSDITKSTINNLNSVVNNQQQTDVIQKEIRINQYVSAIQHAAENNAVLAVKDLFMQALKDNYINLFLLNSIFFISFKSAYYCKDILELYETALQESKKPNIKEERKKELDEALKQHWLEQYEYDWQIKTNYNPHESIIKQKYIDLIEIACKENDINALKYLYAQALKNKFINMINFTIFFNLAYKNNDLDFGKEILKHAKETQWPEKKLAVMRSTMKEWLFEQAAQEKQLIGLSLWNEINGKNETKFQIKDDVHCKQSSNYAVFSGRL